MEKGEKGELIDGILIFKPLLFLSRNTNVDFITSEVKEITILHQRDFKRLSVFDREIRQI